MIGTLAAALLLGHLLGDFMIQQDHWSAHKAKRTLRGQMHMAAHVLTYTSACWAAVYVAAWADGLHLSHSALAIGMAVNGATHWVLDLRSPLERIVRATGHAGWVDRDPRALFIYDQAAHLTILLAIAIGIAAA
jgi:hypothetical protein